MNDLLFFILIVGLGVMPIGSLLLWALYSKSILLHVSLVKFNVAMLCTIGGYIFAIYGAQTLYFIVPFFVGIFIVSSKIIEISVKKPLVEHKKKLDGIAQNGNLNIVHDARIISLNNEIGDIARSFSKLITSLKNISKFTDNVSRGNLDSELTLLSDKDEIGRSLIGMRNSILESNEREEQLKKEEYNRNWISNGVANFNEILYAQNSNINEISYKFISTLVDYVGANQGAIFVINESSDDIYYEMLGVVAYDREKRKIDKFKIGEGLVGRCAFEKDPIYIREVPNNYISITSGLGEATPKTIMLVPSIMNEKVYAVIELASFGELDDYKKEFLAKLSETVATSISSIKITEETKQLFENSKTQGDKLIMQEEEMRQNLEEMQATQEEMNRLRVEERAKICELEAKIGDLEAQLRKKK